MWEVRVTYRLRRNGVEGESRGGGRTIQQAVAAIRRTVDRDNGYQGVDITRVDIEKEPDHGVQV